MRKPIKVSNIGRTIYAKEHQFDYSFDWSRKREVCHLVELKLMGRFAGRAPIFPTQRGSASN